MGIPVAWLKKIVDKQGFLDQAQPNWSDTFDDIDTALYFYASHMHPDEFDMIEKAQLKKVFKGFRRVEGIKDDDKAGRSSEPTTASKSN